MRVVALTDAFIETLCHFLNELKSKLTYML